MDIALLVIGVVTVVLLIFLVARSMSGNGIETVIRDELRQNRDEASAAGLALRKEITENLTLATGVLTRTLSDLGITQQSHLEAVSRQLSSLTESNQQRIDALNLAIHNRLRELQESNEKKLEAMRATVDEKLQTTLEKRLGESFKVVSANLEAVQQGLGEMRNLASGVGDLKNVLSNVKVRGTWAEIQLGAILEQMLTPDQFVRNARVRDDSDDVVEYAIKLPGKRNDPTEPVLLPIDSKFPQEPYLRLIEASETGDPEAVRLATTDLLRIIRSYADTIAKKYVSPPTTTPFAVMYLPTEGMYAEVLRQPGILEELQQRAHVNIAGPTTLSALVSSLQAGFMTLAIERRASEVWNLLGAVKTEFGKFGDLLQSVSSHLERAQKTLEKTGVRTRAIERKLRQVEELPTQEAQALLTDDGLDQAEVVDDEETTNGGREDLPF